MFVYAIVDRKTQMVLYIGMTLRTIGERYKEHITNSRSCIDYSKISSHIKQYGEDSVEILEFDYAYDEKTLRDREWWWINELKPPCNVAYKKYFYTKNSFMPDSDGVIRKWKR